jgi:hypothetical protein
LAEVLNVGPSYKCIKPAKMADHHVLLEIGRCCRSCKPRRRRCPAGASGSPPSGRTMTQNGAVTGQPAPGCALSCHCRRWCGVVRCRVVWCRVGVTAELMNE